MLLPTTTGLKALHGLLQRPDWVLKRCSLEVLNTKLLQNPTPFQKSHVNLQDYRSSSSLYWWISDSAINRDSWFTWWLAPIRSDGKIFRWNWSASVRSLLFETAGPSDFFFWPGAVQAGIFFFLASPGSPCAIKSWCEISFAAPRQGCRVCSQVGFMDFSFAQQCRVVPCWACGYIGLGNSGSDACLRPGSSAHSQKCKKQRQVSPLKLWVILIQCSRVLVRSYCYSAVWLVWSKLLKLWLRSLVLIFLKLLSK